MAIAELYNKKNLKNNYICSKWDSDRNGQKKPQDGSSNSQIFITWSKNI